MERVIWIVADKGAGWVLELEARLRDAGHEPLKLSVADVPPATWPAAVVLDADADGGAGIRWLEETAGRLPARVPVVLLAHDDSAGLADRALRAGATVLLTKPVDPERILLALHRLANHPRASTRPT